MNKKQTKMKNGYPVTVSDWITFLESNAYTNTNLYVFMGSILIVIIIALISLDEFFDIFYIFIAEVLVISIFIIIGILGYASKRIKHYQQLSQRIIEGELTNPLKIREEYRKFRKKI